MTLPLHTLLEYQVKSGFNMIKRRQMMIRLPINNSVRQATPVAKLAKHGHQQVVKKSQRDQTEKLLTMIQYNSTTVQTPPSRLFQSSQKKRTKLRVASLKSGWPGTCVACRQPSICIPYAFCGRCVPSIPTPPSSIDYLYRACEKTIPVRTRAHHASAMQNLKPQPRHEEGGCVLYCM